MHQIITHFTDDDLYKLTMCVAVIDNFPRTQVRYRFTDRNDTVYPPGFADELRRQIRALQSVVISDDEIDYMKRRCRYIPDWFYSYLKGFRYDADMVAVNQDDQGRLDITFEGSWSSTILLEVKVLAIVSELFYIMTGQAEAFDYGDFTRRTLEKGRRLIEAGCMFSDFGTRRRASSKAQDIAVASLAESRRRASQKKGGLSEQAMSILP